MTISWRMLLKQDYGKQRGKKNYFLSGADRLENFIATSLVGNLWLFFPCSSIKVCYINLVSFLSSELQHFTFFYSLLQLDSNLIEGEPYNHLAWKNKRQVARQNSNISEMWETDFKTCQNKQRHCGSKSSVVNTEIFCARPPTCGPKNITC